MCYLWLPDPVLRGGIVENLQERTLRAVDAHFLTCNGILLDFKNYRPNPSFTDNWPMWEMVMQLRHDTFSTSFAQAQPKAHLFIVDMAISCIGIVSLGRLYSLKWYSVTFDFQDKKSNYMLLLRCVLGTALSLSLMHCTLFHSDFRLYRGGII